MDWIHVHNLPVARVDLAVVEGPDSHDDADVVVALPVRVDGVRRHPTGIGGEGESRRMDGMGLQSDAIIQFTYALVLLSQVLLAVKSWWHGQSLTNPSLS